MSCDISVCRASEQRYDELMQVLDESFSFFDKGSQFIDLLPKLYKKENKPWENNICVLEDGKIKAAVGLYYSDFYVCGEKLRFGGIGNVGVHPSARGKGYMKLAMKSALDEMKTNGTVFSVLDGQRQRYQYFGFDNVGSKIEYSVTKTNMRHVYGVGAKSDITAEPLKPDDNAALDSIYRSNMKSDAYCPRERGQIFDILRSWKAVPYKLSRDGKTVGYFIADSHKRFISEFAVFESADMENSFKAVMQLLEADEVVFSFPSYDRQNCAFFEKLAGYFTESTCCKLAVFNFKRMLSALCRLKQIENEVPNMRFSCLIHGIAGDEKLEICSENGLISVSEYKGVPDIELSALEAVEFFFAPRCDKRRAIKYSGLGMLPLPFCIISPDHV